MRFTVQKKSALESFHLEPTNQKKGGKKRYAKLVKNKLERKEEVVSVVSPQKKKGTTARNRGKLINMA